jgi:hypothetical protein
MVPVDAAGEALMRRLVATFALAASLAALASLAPGSPVPSACAAAGSHHAALVVEHGDGSVVTRCVAFDASQVTGEQLLNASGIAWSGQTFGGFGDAVCAMDGEPARYSSCPGTDGYWAVFVARGSGAWQLSNVGVSTLTLADGDAEGFRYVPSSGNPVAPPLAVGVCAAAVSPATTATATPAAVVAATATATPAATATAVAPPTARRTAAASDVAAAIGSAASASPEPADSPVAAVTGTTASAAPTVFNGDAHGTDAAVPTAPQAPGPDLGLLAAALAGGGLGGLALLRLLALRRPSR